MRDRVREKARSKDRKRARERGERDRSNEERLRIYRGWVPTPTPDGSRSVFFVHNTLNVFKNGGERRGK